MHELLFGMYELLFGMHELLFGMYELLFGMYELLFGMHELLFSDAFQLRETAVFGTAPLCHENHSTGFTPCSLVLKIRAS
jgi:hypothetical protein